MKEEGISPSPALPHSSSTGLSMHLYTAAKIFAARHKAALNYEDYDRLLRPLTSKEARPSQDGCDGESADEDPHQKTARTRA